MIALALLALLPSLAGTGAPQAPAPAQAAPAAYNAQPGPFAVEVARYDWGDARRERDVPAKLYYPAVEKGPFPVIIFSHGAGGSREGYEYLGRHWASYGYVSVHLQHEGSDEAVWRGRADPLEGIRESIGDVRNALARPADVSFAIDQMELLNREEGPLRGRLDLARVGVAGHSFGAWTTLAVAGQTFVLPGGRELTLRDARVKAAIPMSAPVPARRETHARAFGSIAIPCLHMTGTLDSSIVSDTAPEQRRIPYDNISKADQYLVTFIGGDHMVFSGRGRLPGGAKDAAFQDLIKAGTTAFWDAYLKEDPAAKEWLAGGGYERLLGKEASFEKVLAAAR
jgi:predicted dienelactone hydrolase